MVRVEAGEQARVMSHGTVTGINDESTIGKDESTEKEEHYEAESNEPRVEFEDPIYELMQEEEMEEEYEEMTPEWEKELVSQLTTQERAEYREMSDFYCTQVDVTKQGMELRSTMIKARMKQRAPGLPPDLIQRIVKEELDLSKQDIGQISEVEWQAILHKHEKIPCSTRPGTEKGYYVYVEDEGGVYIETIDEKGIPTSVLDTNMDRQLVMDRITKQNAEKYFVQPGEQEDGDERETISSTSTADYNQDKVEASLANITEAFHRIGNEYEHLCAIVPHMTKIQAANVIGQLPIIPFVGKSRPVKVEMKAEPRKSEPTMTKITAVSQEVITEAPNITRPEETTVVQFSLRMSPVTETSVGTIEVDIEKDAEVPQQVTEMTEELGTEMEKADQYSRYVLSGKENTPEQKVNKAVKDLNYHNMVVVIAVGDKMINNVGSICEVAEKWGLSFSVVQRVLSGVKEHRQGGQQYDKLAGRPQRRSR